jgi:serine/threonine-protein kinase
MSSLLGRTVDGRYRIEALLGEGAVGAVYRVIEISTGRVLALKQWSASALDAEVRRRFLREASALDVLDHPNIVKVFGHGVAGNVPYMVLEYLPGKTLETLLGERGALDVALAMDIARQALSAIAYAHQHNVVHRDIKPENIVLMTAGSGRLQAKILDYGLAKFMAPTGDPIKDKTLTATGTVVGTLLYMPPEQATGVSVDLPVDVYAMGCVLFEMLTGRLPFEGGSRMELLKAHMGDPIPKLAELRSDIPQAPLLQALIDRALAKKQTERYPHAGAMLADLERIDARASQTPAARVSARSPRTDHTRRRSPLLFAIGVAVVAAIAVVLTLLRD